jgi:hypothetical protein
MESFGDLGKTSQDLINGLEAGTSEFLLRMFKWQGLDAPSEVVSTKHISEVAEYQQHQQHGPALGRMLPFSQFHKFKQHLLSIVNGSVGERLVNMIEVAFERII